MRLRIVPSYAERILRLVMAYVIPGERTMSRNMPCDGRVKGSEHVGNVSLSKVFIRLANDLTISHTHRSSPSAPFYCSIAPKTTAGREGAREGRARGQRPAARRSKFADPSHITRDPLATGSIVAGRMYGLATNLNLDS